MIIPSWETLVETRACSECAASFGVTDRDMTFYDQVSPVFAGKKESIPPPACCPDCRARRRLAWRNERKLYRRKCDLAGRDIVSNFEPHVAWPVYETAAWYADESDYLRFGREFDFGRTLGEQLRELRDVVPQKSRSISNTLENSDYCDNAGALKDCYLCFNIDYAESCLYCITARDIRSCMDGTGIYASEHCYECSFCTKCYDLRWSAHCVDCRSSSLLLNCRQCEHCHLCANLANARYCIENVQYSPEEYARIVASRTPAEWRARATEFFARFPVPHMHSVNAEASTGENLRDVKDCVASYTVADSDNIRHCSDLVGARDMMDVELWGDRTAACYESSVVGAGAHRLAFCIDCWENVSNLLYCVSCTYDVSDCFACVGLRHKRFCILNKQYTEAEYNELVPRIIEHMRRTGEWGEAIHQSLSYHGLNNTKANEEYPLSREEALKRGYNWSDYEAPFPKVEKVIPANKLPENIKDIPDDILQWAVECEVTRRPFRIVKQELEFYRKHDIAIPRRHPDQRHLDRLALRNPRKLYERACDKCSKDIVTTYSPDRPERVYCEECYHREVYG